MQSRRRKTVGRLICPSRERSRLGRFCYRGIRRSSFCIISCCAHRRLGNFRPLCDVVARRQNSTDVEEVDANDALTEGVGVCECKDDVLKVLAVTLPIVGLLVECTKTEGEYDFRSETTVER